MHGCALLNDGTTALSWGHDETLRLWDLSSGRLSEGCAEGVTALVACTETLSKLAPGEKLRQEEALSVASTQRMMLTFPQQDGRPNVCLHIFSPFAKTAAECREWQGRMREFVTARPSASVVNNAELEAGPADGGKALAPLAVEDGGASPVTRAAGFSPAAQARTLQVQTMPSRAE